MNLKVAYIENALINIKTKTVKTILVSYDLVAPGRNYDELLDHLRSYSGYCNPLESFWLVRTSFSETEVRDKVANFLDSNDKLLVMDVSGDAAAWRGLSSDNATWIKNNL